MTPPDSRATEHEVVMRRRAKMCESCPFRGADDDYKRECADIIPELWPCHSEGYFGADSDIQCRGHYEARRKFPTPTQGTHDDP